MKEAGENFNEDFSQSALFTRNCQGDEMKNDEIGMRVACTGHFINSDTYHLRQVRVDLKVTLKSILKDSVPDYGVTKSYNDQCLI
jgi:hypothetical protein